MGRPRRRSSVRLDGDGSPEGLAARLPDQVRRFRPSTDPDDFRAHQKLIEAMVGERLAVPVMMAAGLSAASWYRQALSLSSGPTLRVVK